MVNATDVWTATLVCFRHIDDLAFFPFSRQRPLCRSTAVTVYTTVTQWRQAYRRDNKSYVSISPCSAITTDPADPTMREGAWVNWAQNYGVYCFTQQKREIWCHQMQFLGCQNALKYVFGRGSISDPTGGAHSTPPNLLAALRGPTRKEKQSRGKQRDRRKGKRGQKVRAGREKTWKEGKERRRALNDSLAGGGRNLKLCHCDIVSHVTVRLATSGNRSHIEFTLTKKAQSKMRQMLLLRTIKDVDTKVKMT